MNYKFKYTYLTVKLPVGFILCSVPFFNVENKSIQMYTKRCGVGHTSLEVLVGQKKKNFEYHLSGVVEDLCT